MTVRLCVTFTGADVMSFLAATQPAIAIYYDSEPRARFVVGLLKMYHVNTGYPRRVNLPASPYNLHQNVACVF